MYPLYFAGIDQGTKTKIQIGDVPATLYVNENGNNCIQFIKNGIEYTVGNLPDKGISLDELKKICESIVVPVNSPPTSISDGLSLKTLKK